MKLDAIQNNYHSEDIMDTYMIEFGNHLYNYYLYNSISEEYLHPIMELKDAESVVIICDTGIERLYGRKILAEISKTHQCDLISFQCGEDHKNLKVLEELVEKILALKANRQTYLIALGGGICGNITGMAAALLFRGIKFIHIPTSLMAMLDSVLSLKQAINSSHGKNLIGVFYKPEMVITNIGFLKSLPKCEIVSGMCEVVKNALTILPESIEPLLNKLAPDCNYSTADYHYFISISIKAKTMKMKEDPFEKQEGLVLEYGHTIGHAIELASKEEITHGEAVGIGMLCAAEIAHRLGYLSENDVILHKTLLEKSGASFKIPGHLSPEIILSFMKFDNKRGYLHSEKGAFHMVLLEKIGKPLHYNDKLLYPVSEDMVRQAIGKVCAFGTQKVNPARALSNSFGSIR